MKHVLFVVTFAALASTAFAGQNPDIRVYLDFDPPNGIHRIDPEPNTIFDVYIVTDCFGADGGLRVIGIVFERTFGAYRMGEYNLLGGLTLGHVDDPYHGWVAAAAEECVYPDDDGIVIVGYVRYYYTGPPGYIRVYPPEIGGRAAVDCDFHEDDYWCVAANAGVGVDPWPPEPECDCGGHSPVESGTWGSIKALYR